MLQGEVSIETNDFFSKTKLSVESSIRPEEPGLTHSPYNGSHPGFPNPEFAFEETKQTKATMQWNVGVHSNKRAKQNAKC